MGSRIAIVIILPLLGLACSHVEEKVVTALLQNYVSAQEALAADNLEEAKLAFQLLADESDPDLKVIAKQLADSSTLDEARSQFKPLSEQIAKIELPKGYSLVRCPMADEGKGARWIQKEGEIKNPYFGEKMKTCGTVEKTGE